MLFQDEDMSSEGTIRSALKELHTPPHDFGGCLCTDAGHAALQLGLNLSPQLMLVEQSLGRSGAGTTSAHKPSCFILTTPGRLAAPEDLFLHEDRYTNTAGGCGSM